MIAEKRSVTAKLITVSLVIFNSLVSFVALAVLGGFGDSPVSQTDQVILNSVYLVLASVTIVSVVATWNGIKNRTLTSLFVWAGPLVVMFYLFVGMIK